MSSSAATSPPQRVSACRLCDSTVHSIVDLGPQPVAQNFSCPEAESEGLAYRLEPAICTKCGLVQLLELPPDDALFTSEYAYRTGVSSWMRQHLHKVAENLLNRLRDTSDPFIVEIGCNDGTLLAPFVQSGIRHLGIDPAAKAVATAIQNGANVKVGRFSERTALTLRDEMGQADAIVAINVIAHIRDLRDTARAVEQLLAPSGVFVFEAVYIENIIGNTAFDQFYDEHVYTFSCTTAQFAFGRVGLELIDLQDSPNQGGSKIYTFAHQGARPKAEVVDRTLAEEARLGYGGPDIWAAFADRCGHIKEQLSAILSEYSARGVRVSGYGATAKSATVIQYCGLSRQSLECVYDTTPGKIGKTMPHSGIPIRHADQILTDGIDHLLLFAWNHRPEIERREARFSETGGKWIHYVPSVKTL